MSESLDFARAGNCLRDFDFKRLFIEELGWDHLQQAATVSDGGRDYALEPIAEKRGFAVYLCLPPSGVDFPDYTTRRRIDREIMKQVREHLIIFVDAARRRQTWQWVKREAGKPAQCREFTKHVGDSGDLLLQRLQAIVVALDEEEQLGLPDVTQRIRAAFDLEPVTKRFYERFKDQRDAFSKFLKGIPLDWVPDDAKPDDPRRTSTQRWYVSVMLDRLMFVYFVQQKGFLDGDRQYLRTKLNQSRAEGPDRYYREYLCPLFFEGFAKQPDQRTPEVAERLGTVPYLNGGLFLRHQIEEQHGETIQIPDVAFANLFDFFDQYRWHLDERPLRAQNEINPDVLGFIFEKYINQKQMGAYYTKEDITDYISKSAIIPFLFDAAERKCGIAFEGATAVWRLLVADPDRYIYPAVRHGAHLALPAHIAAGLDDVAQRGRWNEPAGDEYALPTEIWREVVARRRRYEEVRAKLAAGEVCSVNDLVTLNLDIRQFAQDVLEGCEGPDLLVAFWDAIERVTVLDPTCGSGAFLFAALNILEPLYEACLDRMQFFLDEWGETGRRQHPNYAKRFDQVLGRVDQHPNHRYFVLKSIVVNNLFGVDLMDEAVEICKLRLFLKLVAQVESAEQIEPLPDIDFNVRAGNTLVGYASYDEVEAAIEYQGFDFDENGPRIRAAAAKLANDTTWYRELQTDWEVAPGTLAEAKQAVREKRKALVEELDRHLAQQHGTDVNNPGALSAWRRTHQPLHWLVEFYGIMAAGGFDVIIGNPPYVEYRPAQFDYQVRSFRSLPCGDLYAFTTERAIGLMGAHARLGLIIPISVFGTDGFQELQRICLSELGHVWASFYANRPSQLFDGAQKRLTVVLGSKAIDGPVRVSTSSYLRWRRGEFAALFPSQLRYIERPDRFRVLPASLEKLGSPVEEAIFARLIGHRGTLAESVVKESEHRVYYTRKFGYFLGFLDFVPRITNNKTGALVAPSELKCLCFSTRDDSMCAVAALCSSTFFWFWNVLSDCRNVNRRDLLVFPLVPTKIAAGLRGALVAAADAYLTALRSSSRTMQKSGLTIETFDYGASKPQIDAVDRVLARHYGFTDEELDFIVNYDIKYRMGRDGGGADDEE